VANSQQGLPAASPLADIEAASHHSLTSLVPPKSINLVLNGKYGIHLLLTLLIVKSS